MKIQDTVFAIFNDEHSGSRVAPVPPGLEFRDIEVRQSKLQRLLDEQHIEYCQEVAKRRKGKRLVVVKLGDSVDGVHHETKELVTSYISEQKEINEEITNRALKITRYNKDTDSMFWVAGTPAHAGEAEEDLAKTFGIKKTNGRRVLPVLNLKVNGVDCLFFHHGSNKGKGANKGNSFRNRMKDMYYDYRDAGKNPPQLVVTADKHAHWYEPFVRGDFMMHGIISPAWQVKTDFVYKIASEALTNIGGAIIEITADGKILFDHKKDFITICVEEGKITL